VKVLITGATGVVGGAVLRHLLAAGEQVTALVRAGRSPAGPTAVRQGDVLNYPSLREACRGAEIVYHVAGINRMCQRNPSEMFHVNIDGSRNVVRACRAAGVRRLVYTSSAGAIGEAAGEVGTEDTVHSGRFLSNYERSKYEAEQAVRAEAGDLEVVIVNPSSVQGPGRATGTGKLIIDLLAGKLPFVVDTTVSIVDIDDCGRGHLLAAERGQPGRRYLLNSFTMTIREAVAVAESVVGRPLPVRFVPALAAKVAAGLAAAGYRLVGRAPPVCPEMVRTAVHGHRYDGSRATRELGLEYTRPEETLGRLFSWARDTGLLT
jgi:dihydroflavonol-4-reductase